MRYMCSTGRWPVAFSSLATSSRELALCISVKVPYLSASALAPSISSSEQVPTPSMVAKHLMRPSAMPSIGLDVALGQIEPLLQRHLLEIVRAFVAVRAGMIPHPAAGGGAHADFLDRLDRRVEPHAAGLDEARRAGADHLRHQALGVPVLILFRDRRHVGIAPELQPVARAQRIRDQAAGDLAEMRMPVDQPGHDEPHRGVDRLAPREPLAKVAVLPTATMRSLRMATAPSVMMCRSWLRVSKVPCSIRISTFSIFPSVSAH